MHWTRKAQIQRTCARLPFGDRIYQQIQRRFGNLAVNPAARTGYHAQMMGMLTARGFDPRGGGRALSTDHTTS